MGKFSICFPHRKTMQKVGACHILHVEEYLGDPKKTGFSLKKKIYLHFI